MDESQRPRSKERGMVQHIDTRMKTEQKYEIIDNIKGISKLQDNSIDLTVTSPPYDNLRTYNGYSFDFETIAKELFRVTKDGGIVVWVVGDQTNNGSESGTSFKQALFFKEVGFNLFDTMIYAKGGQGATGSNKAYWQDFEYMFVFSKGIPSTFNPIEDRKNIVSPHRRKESMGHRYKNGDVKGKRRITRKEYGRRSNIWVYHECGTNTNHPAVFPEQLAKDHILSWSNEGDWILDPFLGSGTTLKMCMELNRNGIGFEINDGYESIIKERLKLNHRKLDAFNTSA